MPSKRRSAALVVSAFVEPGGNPNWYARISSYADTLAPATQGPAETTVQGVCEAVQAWLEGVIEDPSENNESSPASRQSSEQ